ncbi:MAG: hypothetical protein R3190_15720, partial [Thermoanaerobaculia bacterium]|nr:hypothetical protein [Thermoanaerobaculia bacterium]
MLAIGLAVGIVVALRLRRRRPTAADRDRDLEIADLEQRRDELYRKLREEDEETLEPEDRRELELAAARTLKRLD